MAARFSGLSSTRRRSFVRLTGRALSDPASSPYRMFEEARARTYAPNVAQQPAFNLPPPPPPFSGPIRMGTYDNPFIVTVQKPPSPWVRGMLFLFAIWLLYDHFAGDEDADDDSSPIDAGKRATTSKLFGVGNTTTEYKPVDVGDVKFDDVLGCDEAKAELVEIVEFLKDRERFEALGGKLPKGLLLVGRPGTGKTMLAKAIAAEAGVSFFYASGSEFDEVFVGLGAKRVRDLFKAAKKHAPALVFLDEIDAVGMSRSAQDASTSRQTLNQLLSEMDGFTPSQSIIVIAATNVESGLDAALTRPGRFDRTVHVNVPDMKGRTAILKSYISKIVSAGLDATIIAKNTVGLAGADLANIINTAAIRAAQLKKAAVDATDVDYAIDRVSMGLEHRTLMGEKEKRLTAIHEGGHTLCAMLLADADPVHKVTIVGRGPALGFTRFAAETDQVSRTVSELRSRLVVSLGGYVAEELAMGLSNTTTGASNDLEQAHALAREMVTRYGFGPNAGVLGVVGSREFGGRSEPTKERVDRDADIFVRDAYAEAKRLLSAHRKDLDLIADALVEHETLTRPQLEWILKTKSTSGMPPATLSSSA